MDHQADSYLNDQLWLIVLFKTELRRGDVSSAVSLFMDLGTGPKKKNWFVFPI